MIIRDYRKNDRSALANLIRSAFEQYRFCYEGFDLLLERITDIEGFDWLGEIIVAEDNGVVVGAVTYVAPNHTKTEYFPKECPFMLMLVVNPKARGQGIGNSLIDECLIRAERDKAATISLHTTAIMKVAVAMYERKGFHQVSLGPTIHGVEYRAYTKTFDR